MAIQDAWQCRTINFGYMYDPDQGDMKGKVPKGVGLRELPDSWRCPICGGMKKSFRPLAGPGSTREARCEPSNSN